MIELDERICYSPRPPEAYSRGGVGHGLWCENRLTEWNVCWVSFPAVDQYLNPSADLRGIVDSINPQHWGAVLSIGQGTWDGVFPGLRGALRQPPAVFLKHLLEGPFHLIAPYKILGDTWIATVQARVEESQPGAFVAAPVTVGNVIYAKFGGR